MPWDVLILLALFTVFFVPVYRRLKRSRDPEWRARWLALPLRDRLRISRTVRRGERLPDPKEAMLAVGAAHQQRLLPSPKVGAVLILALGSLFALAGIVQGSALEVLGGLALAGFGVWRLQRSRNLTENLSRAEEVNRS